MEEDFGALFGAFTETTTPAPAATGVKRKADAEETPAETEAKRTKVEATSTTPSPAQDTDSKHTDASDHATDRGLALPAYLDDSDDEDDVDGKDINEEFLEFTPQTFFSKDHPKGDGHGECHQEMCFPPHWKPEQCQETWQSPTPQYTPAKTYEYTLDAFQRVSVECIEVNQNVLVSAHTSAGKTTVAEYAIAKALKEGARVIYTSPIKALSNQKYRELFEEFGDVGLMTGDVTINPSASCLVMTTEILRNMLYRGSEVVREVSWVVFDEIHYMKDRERGVVWEETIILLPRKARFVFLSATIPNAREFAFWVAKLNRHPCNVVYTEYRPVPLQHYVFPGGGSGLYLVVDDKGVFREDNFQKAISSLAAPEDIKAMAGQGGKKKKNKKKSQGQDIYKIVRMVMERKLDPVICFSFAKRETEANALAMSKLDFCDEEEKKMVMQIFNNAIDSLSEDDKQLPQVSNVLPLLKRGIGIHHSGLLPILKEVIEILFGEGLLKCLFATETFAMGLNMPAKTVIFTSNQKFDGKETRTISSGEYIQMSGRAGRRGKDDRGIVILMCDERMESTTAKTILKGAADVLTSSFHLGYNMLLNLLRVEGADPEYMIARSFHQFQSLRSSPELKKELLQLEEQRDAIEVPQERKVAEYYLTQQSIAAMKTRLVEVRNKPLHVIQFLNPGRLVQIKNKEQEWGWGILISFKRKNPVNGGKKKSILSDGGDAKDYVLDVLLHCKPRGKGSQAPQPQPCSLKREGSWEVVPCQLDLVQELSTIRVYLPKNLRQHDARKTAGKSLHEVMARFKDVVPQLDPVDDMRIKDKAFTKLMRRMETLEDKLKSMKISSDPDIKALHAQYAKKTSIDDECAALKDRIRALNTNHIIKSNLKAMKRVLRRLELVDENNVVQLKGRVACDISTADELLATELLFSGLFQELSPPQIVAVVSAMIFDEKSKEGTRLSEELAGPFRKLKEAARRIAEVSKQSKLQIDPDEYLEKFCPDMMEVCFAWCNGAKFSDICKLTNIFEGSIIRVMRRLEEALAQLVLASQTVGNDQMEEKFRAGIKLIKRDIIFAASLYL